MAQHSSLNLPYLLLSVFTVALCTTFTHFIGVFYLFVSVVFPSVGCGGVFTASQGTLRSPGYPNGYPPSKHCVYLISQPSSYRISLTFSAFDVENAAESCTDNYVEVSRSTGCFFF